ncbi:MAG: fatty acid desaturase [Hoeflea sp. BRH_c9]|nr:MAG: fatty acid desaturase [Hoeflea sp. BRH_c9]MDP2733743.1 fatty acid desaturase [Hoeflea sp.]
MEPSSARDWVGRLRPYRQPDDRRGIIETILTGGLLVVFWVLMWFALPVSTLLTLLLSVPAALMMVRLFIIQHDCGHGSMFTSAKWNDRVGRALGVVTLTPYDYWRRSHALHHSASGNLDRRGIGDIDTLTVKEYLALSGIGRLKYRLYRHPIVMFGIGPAFIFLLQHRMPVAALKDGVMSWASVMATNLAIAAMWVALGLLVGFKAFLIIHLPIMLIGASIGVWMFYVQHQFNPTHWDRAPDWEREFAALHGSSFYDLPKPLMWLTGNIGIHHVHHLSSRIPYYRLPQVMRDFPELAEIGRLTLWESFRCVPLALWDEDRRRLVPFRALRNRTMAAAA